MSDTLFADISSYQVPVNDQYPYQFISIRSNDGTYRDPDFAANLAWTKHAVDTGKLTGFLVYFVWEPNWQQTVQTFKAMVGTPHPKMAVMIDIESWSGRITGNQSAGLNAAREAVISWLGGNRSRVIGYGNAGDLNGLWPNRGDAKVILANYSSNPSFPGKIAHQFASNFNVPPFGPCDINSADGYSPTQFATALGLNPVVIKPVEPGKPIQPQPQPGKPVQPVTGSDRLAIGSYVPGTEIVSPNGSTKAIFQTDGNLVVYSGGKAIYNTRTASSESTVSGRRFYVQPDGNLVIYGAPGEASVVWQSHSASGAAGTYTLVVQNDGNLVMYNVKTSAHVWDSKHSR